MYSLRLLLLVFFFKPNFFFTSLPQESSAYISLSLFSLAICSVFIGYLFSDLFSGWGSHFWSHSLIALPLSNQVGDTLLLSPIQRNLPLIFSCMGWLVGFALVVLHEKWGSVTNSSYGLRGNFVKLYVNSTHLLSSFFYYAGFFNTIYNKLFLDIYLISYKINTKLIDKGILELLGPVGIYRIFFNLNRGLWNINSSVFLNIGFMFFSLVLFFVYGIFYEFTLAFYLIHYGILPLSLLLIYNEFYKGFIIFMLLGLNIYILFFYLVVLSFGVFLFSNYLRIVSMYFFSLFFFLCLSFFFFFNKLIYWYQYYTKIYRSLNFNIIYLYGLDGLSLFLILLSSFLILICLLNYWFLRYQINLYILLSICLCFFCLMYLVP